MTTVVRRRPNPVTEILNWFDEPGMNLRGLGLTPYVRIEDYVEDDTYVIKAEMPGIDPEEDVNIQVDGDMLVIQGERRDEEHEKNRHEFHYGSFSRTLPLPHGCKAEDITATYTDGVLKLTVPLEGQAEAPRRIPVQRQTS